ncbi:hypothetical protein A4G99_20870 [Haladaptatus sp. R4]|uniref:hypothetical protein n=1 Tax=Haladaptatus sp. R4 TaxID=1679489 RepID=UPI0007B4E0C9|nr:hypothetical protein [Haladaptatus sp. R4]KZN26497.1 hypothetical protein A4G99_20870 [Haladaptatus sp. R4]
MPDHFPTVRVAETELKVGRTPAHPEDEFEFQPDDSLADDSFVATAIEPTREMTNEHPPSVEVSITNVRDTPIDVTFGATPPLDVYPGKDDAEGLLYLIPLESDDVSITPERLVPDSMEHGIWRVTESFTIPESVTILTIEPGKSITGEYAVLGQPLGKERGSDAPSSARGLVPGTYAFVGDYFVDETTPSIWIQWKFELVVEA